MKTDRNLMFGGLVIVAALGALVACSPAASAAPAAEPLPLAEPAPSEGDSEPAAVAIDDEYALMMVDESGITSVDETALDAALAGYAVGDLSANEAAGLLYMREEEKLAHDVYLTLYAQWGISIFQNIANSEQTHTEAVRTLIERYGLEDPAASNGAGVFADPALQALYDQLVAEGSESLASALHVGAAIEEIDILDLEGRIAQTDNADIIRVYQNLMGGSENHLRAFVSTLARQTGETYQPQYLDQATYDAIAGAPMGGQGRGRGGN